ncbi:hypothetical protein LPJ66_006756 [Kickxella alabastrina]|uniref:Uncharacterized protein n=1 Tax=Kickxella alabastrina TaxID=61397 RepID=A0ACC1IB17_9FUNG|nr:hypothetical protein LPJ66_006756 [Kickxella alabastrina]
MASRDVFAADGSCSSSASKEIPVDEFGAAVRAAFEEAYARPSVAAGVVRRTAQAGVVSASITTWQRDFTGARKRRVAQTLVLGIGGGHAAELAAGAAADVSSEVQALESPTDAALRAVLRGDKGARAVEVWRGGVLQRSFDVAAAHGDFYGDATFGSLAWSNDNSVVVYAAEPPAQPAHGADMAASLDASPFALDGDWGETFGGKRPPVLVALRVADGAVRVLQTPRGVSPGQALFLPGAAHRIAFVGYEHGARKPGLAYCQNRPAALFVGALAGGFERVHSGAVRSPRLAPSGRTLVFLETGAGGPHAAASALRQCDLATGAVQTLVPVVARAQPGPQTLGGTRVPGGFPGLYADQLPRAPWLRVANAVDRDVLALSSTWRSTSAVLTLDLHARRLARHSPVDGAPAVAADVLGCAGDLVAATRSTPAAAALAVGEAALGADGDVEIAWHAARSEGAGNMTWSVEPIGPAECAGHIGRPGFAESILVLPAAPAPATRFFWPAGAAGPPPLVVMPHGGPHAAHTLAYGAQVAALVRLGLGVLLVNFTGSLGFGQDAVAAQIGRIDSLALAEIQAAAQAVHAAGRGDARRTVYMGGSYAGYTGALLAARAPGFYRGFVLRNPVVAMAANAVTSDIADWCWAELGLAYDFQAPPLLTPPVYEKMWAASPAAEADAVRDPVLLLLGANDRRVPPQQSFEYYARLKAAGKRVHCRVYPGVGHPLDSVEAERDGFDAIARFCRASLDGEDEAKQSE